MFEIAEYIGIVAFAISGFFVGVRSRLDFLGVFISVFLTAFGGGIIRDVIVDRTPYAFSSDVPAAIILIVLVLLLLLKYHRRESIENRPLFILSDSIGLISFSITGALIALEAHLNITGVLALAFITAVGGGITRDVIINEVPFVFKTGFYGTVSLLIGLGVYLLEQFGWMNFYMITLLFAGGVILRMIAYYRKWSVPLV
ncbi:MAG: TRIC cation channel family protein [Sulfurovum sp.]|nr:TRIC cation channel family protein [Sulfurovum sp.]